jgi:capsular exopolysaccharide synthesis family protein
MVDFVYTEKKDKADRAAAVEANYTKLKTELQNKREAFNAEEVRVRGSAGTTDPNVLDYQQRMLQENLHNAFQRRDQLESKIGEAKIQLEVFKARAKLVEETTIGDAEVSRELAADPLMKVPLETIVHMTAVIEDHYSRSKEDNYRSKEALQRKAAAEATVEKRRAEIKKDLTDRIKSGSGQGAKEREAAQRFNEENVALQEKSLKSLNDGIDRMQTDAEKTGKWSSELTAMLKEIDSKQQVLDSLSKASLAAQADVNSTPRISPFQTAELQKRDAKKQLLATIAAPVAVLFLVCMGVAWLDVRQRRVRSAGDVAAGLGIRVVGAVPGVAGLERRLVGPDGVPDLEGCPAAESFDSLRTMLLRESGPGASRTLLVTSAAAGEGKTTLAAHLASSLARAGRKTLLIDGDLRTPSVHQLYELPMQPGFSEILLGEVEAAEGVQATHQDGLSVMAAGQWDREVLHALARDGLEAVVEKLREEFDFIVIDSHPVLAAADSLLLAQYVDAAILSVLRDVSQTPRVYAASQKLNEMGVRVLGAVVNGADPNEIVAAPAPVRHAIAG